MYNIDARGKQCPIPVILTKKAIDAGETLVVTAVDNSIAVENLMRLAASMGYSCKTEGSDGNFAVTLTKNGSCDACGGAADNPDLGNNGIDSVSAEAAAKCGQFNCGYAVFVGKDYVGAGADEPRCELGKSLMRMALYALAEGEGIPSYLLFMNSGVFICAGGDDDAAASVKKLVERGVTVLVCGTCLNYYGLTDKLRVGAVSNMYDILEAMKSVSNVITL